MFPSPLLLIRDGDGGSRFQTFFCLALTKTASGPFLGRTLKTRPTHIICPRLSFANLRDGEERGQSSLLLEEIEEEIQLCEGFSREVTRGVALVCVPIANSVSFTLADLSPV